MALRRRNQWLWLAMAALLLALGAFLMRGAEPPTHEPPPPVRLPTKMSRAERSLADNRRTWIPQREPDDAGASVRVGPVRDPLLALMPAEVKRAALVAEFNAIVNSELGGLMTQCLSAGADDVMGALRDAGMDPTTKIDRVAIIDDSVVISGDFKNAQWRKLLDEGAVAKGHGRQGEIVEVKEPDGGVETFAAWGGQMFIAGGDEASQRAILDRLEGKGPDYKPALDESSAYGEVYGLVSVAALAELVRGHDARLADIIAQSAKSVQLHMDISHDVGLVADIESSDAQKTEELRKTIGGLLSLARMEAQAKGKAEEAALLELAHVRSAEGGADFRLEAGLPHEFMEKMFRACIERGKRRAERRRAFDAQ